MADSLSDAEIRFLAVRFPPRREAHNLLRQIGFPLERSGATGNRTPYDYWVEIAEEMNDGLLDDGIAKIRQAVLRRFPHNPTFRHRWRLLFMGASPSGAPPLHADGELARIRLHIPDVQSCPAATVADLSRVREFKPHILHFCCHGDGDMLYFEDGRGGTVPMRVQDEVAVLRTYATGEAPVRLRGIVVNACTSAEAASLLRRSADVVIGHREQIKDEDGTAFADRLYRIVTTSQVSLADAARSAAAELVQQEVVVPSVQSGLVIYRAGEPLR